MTQKELVLKTLWDDDYLYVSGTNAHKLHGLLQVRHHIIWPLTSTRRALSDLVATRRVVKKKVRGPGPFGVACSIYRASAVSDRSMKLIHES